MTMDPETAKRRYIQLSLMRMAGIALVILGLALWRRGVFDIQHETAGKLVAVVGVALMFLIPAILRRRWREGK